MRHGDGELFTDSLEWEVGSAGEFLPVGRSDHRHRLTFSSPRTRVGHGIGRWLRFFASRCGLTIDHPVAGSTMPKTQIDFRPFCRTTVGRDA